MLNLALKLRPENLSDFVSQQHLIAKNAPLYNMIENNALPHCIFYGPPGSGKTTLAYIIANALNKPLGIFNATSFKIEDIRKFCKNYENSLYQPLIFIDEIHRLNKAQQEVLLPIMESYSAIICGASTYNPFHSLTNAIRSRSFLFELKPHSKEDLERVLNRAITYIRAEFFKDFDIESDAFSYLISSSGGDARAMLNLLDAGLDSLKNQKTLTLSTLKILRPNALNDGTSEADTHYNLISALIKSIRGSDVNASVYYLARLIAGGEDPAFIARRLVILASEDIGNANPNALNLATSTMLSVKEIGYPESRIILSQCVIYLACCPKSNSAYTAINKAIESIEKGQILPIVAHILPDSKDYLYPHNYGGYVKQQYLAQDLDFVKMSNKGFEKTLSEWLFKLHSIAELADSKALESKPNPQRADSKDSKNKQQNIESSDLKSEND